MKINIEYYLEYKQYRDKDIYLYKISSKSNLIPTLYSYTNMEGITELLKGNIPKLQYKYILLNEEELNMFSKYYFSEVFEKITKRHSFEFEYENLNNEKFNLFRVDYSSHYIYDLNENLIPLFISLNKPLYLINNKDYNLEKIQEILKDDKRIISTFKESLYEKEILKKNNIVISNIPYYNSDDKRNKFMDIGFVPTNEDWETLLNLAKKNNQIKKNSYIPNLSLILLESGILGFKPKKNIILK
jgi:hypothetical protein